MKKVFAVASVVLMNAAFAEPAPSTPQLEEIVVTASKREEKLVNVPSTVDVLSATTIGTLGITRVDDYVGLVPNLAQVSQGAPGASAIIIRGIYTGSQQLTSTTAYYLDEAALSASGFVSGATFIAPDADLVDVDHIEVLKGPQGTLYGASALGGILRIISRKPDLSAFGGTAEADFSTVDGGGQGYGVRGSLNLPLITDKVAVRFNAFRRQDPGYYDNLGTGHSNVNEAQISGGRIAVRILPLDNLTIDLDGLYQTIHAGLGIEQDQQVTLTPAFGPYQYSALRDLPSSTTYRTGGATVSWKNDYGTLTATGSYAKYDSTTVGDASAVYAPFVAGIAEPGASIFGAQNVAAKKTTEEVRYASNRLGRFEFLVGAFHTNEDDLYQTNYPIVNPDGTSPAAFNGILIFSPNPATYKETAGFGDVTFYLSDELDVTAGYRYSKNEQFVDSKTFGVFSLFFPNATYGFDDTSRNYLATIRWRPNESTSLYARAASGYRPGGPNIGATSYPPAQSDTVWSYEAGIKGNLGPTLSYDLAGYHINWEHVQLPGQDPKTSSQITTNGGSAHVDGAELQLLWRPTEGMSIGPNFGYNKTKLVSVAPDITAVIGAVPGDPFPLSPKWTAALIADYTRPLTGRLEGLLGFTYQGLGSRNSSFPGDPTAGNVSLPGYNTFDLRGGLTWAKRYRVNLRVMNVGNKDGVQTYTTTRLFAGEPGVYSNAVRIRPRTIMLSAEADF